MNKAPYLIGIAGPSGSGKTTFAENLFRYLLPWGASHLAIDDYYLPDLSKVKVPKATIRKTDVPQAIDIKLLKTHIQNLREGKEIQKPIYNFETCNRIAKTTTVSPTSFIIVEGVYAFALRELTALFNAKIYIDLDLEECLKRRLKRDIEERGRNSEEILKQNKESIIPTCERYVLPFAEFADLKIQGDQNFEDIKTTVLEFISNRAK
jgi:uridine kinase